MTAPAGLLERIGGRLFPSPQPVDGLITEEDIANARRQGLLGLGAGLLAASGPSTQRTTFTQAVGQGLQAGQQAQQGALDTSMQRRMAGLQAGGLQRDARRQEAVAAARQQIVAQNPMPPESDANRMVAWIDRVFPLFVQSGDDEMISRLTQIRSSIGAQRQSIPQRIDEVVGPDGKPAFGHITPEGVRVIPGAAPFQRQGSAPAQRFMTLVNPATNKPEIAMVDPSTGEPHFTGMVPGNSRDAAGTEGERKGAVLLTMALDAMPVLDEADAPSRIEQLIASGGLREGLSDNRQVYEQAGLIIADAYIRLTSGANAPEPEVRRTMRMITPQAGDSPALLARKRASRQALMRALRLAAGRAEDRATQVEPRRPGETVEAYMARTGQR